MNPDQGSCFLDTDEFMSINAQVARRVHVGVAVIEEQHIARVTSDALKQTREGTWIRFAHCDICADHPIGDDLIKPETTSEAPRPCRDVIRQSRNS